MHGQSQRWVGLKAGHRGGWGGEKWWWKNRHGCTRRTIKKEQKKRYTISFIINIK